ncbi:hypothetical protein [Planktotalea sp.]|uniref:hypothetical protein n=1 Tax=Planktotalea sp. TaxID=2029877 RepID=UPI0025CE4E0E|nr:hypothetical protein [Planktotalea sp.]
MMRSLKGDALDPKGLVAEAYKIDGITAAECRSIFLDWALSFQGDSKEALTVLLDRHGDEDHPMTQVMREGLTASDRPRRRGGWRSRDRP